MSEDSQASKPQNSEELTPSPVEDLAAKLEESLGSNFLKEKRKVIDVENYNPTSQKEKRGLKIKKSETSSRREDHPNVGTTEKIFRKRQTKNEEERKLSKEELQESTETRQVRLNTTFKQYKQEIVRDIKSAGNLEQVIEIFSHFKKLENIQLYATNTIKQSSEEAEIPSLNGAELIELLEKNAAGKVSSFQIPDIYGLRSKLRELTIREAIVEKDIQHKEKENEDKKVNDYIEELSYYEPEFPNEEPARLDSKGIEEELKKFDKNWKPEKLEFPDDKIRAEKRKEDLEALKKDISKAKSLDNIINILARFADNKERNREKENKEDIKEVDMLINQLERVARNQEDAFLLPDKFDVKERYFQLYPFEAAKSLEDLATLIKQRGGASIDPEWKGKPATRISENKKQDGTAGVNSITKAFQQIILPSEVSELLERIELGYKELGHNEALSLNALPERDGLRKRAAALFEKKYGINGVQRNRVMPKKEALPKPVIEPKEPKQPKETSAQTKNPEKILTPLTEEEIKAEQEIATQTLEKPPEEPEPSKEASKTAEPVKDVPEPKQEITVSTEPSPELLREFAEKSMALILKKLKPLQEAALRAVEVLKVSIAEEVKTSNHFSPISFIQEKVFNHHHDSKALQANRHAHRQAVDNIVDSFPQFESLKKEISKLNIRFKDLFTTELYNKLRKDYMKSVFKVTNVTHEEEMAIRASSRENMPKSKTQNIFGKFAGGYRFIKDLLKPKN